MIKLVCVGTVKNKHLLALINDYVERINHYHKLEVVEVKDESITTDEKIILDKEAKRVLEKISSDEYVILLDLHGKSLDSIELSKKLDNLMGHYAKITFVIGGSLGLGEELIKRANERIKLSDLTFLHQMTRLILLEQVYRSFKIINNETYHK